MRALFLKFFAPYLVEIVMGAVALGAVTGLYFYVRHQGVVIAQKEAAEARNAELEAQIVSDRNAFEAALTLKNKQRKEASDARKEVDDAYRRGDVPERVLKFYID